MTAIVAHAILRGNHGRRLVLLSLWEWNFEFENGHEYYSAHGKQLVLPNATELTADFLGWRNQNVFVG
jgi:hypothetical protein